MELLWASENLTVACLATYYMNQLTIMCNPYVTFKLTVVSVNLLHD